MTATAKARTKIRYHQSKNSNKNAKSNGKENPKTIFQIKKIKDNLNFKEVRTELLSCIFLVIQLEVKH